MIYFFNRKSKGLILSEKFRYLIKWDFVKSLIEKYDGKDKPECIIEDVVFFDIDGQQLDFDSFVERKFNDNGNEKLKIDWMIEEMELWHTFASARMKYYANGHSQEVVFEEEELDIIRNNRKSFKEVDVYTKNKWLLEQRLKNIKKGLESNPNRPDELELRQEIDFIISILRRNFQ